MFRKPKRKLKDTLRKKDDEDEKRRRWNDDGDKEEEDNDEDATTTLHDTIVQSKREILDGKSLNKVMSTTNQQKDSTLIMHTFDSDKGADGKLTSRNSDLVTSTAQHHPTTATNSDNTDLINRNDGIYRGDQIRNKFHAGPIRAPTNIRTTARFDYQPDICKDYKDTGFCGYGDTCIYLHDRTDTISGWQLEQQWEQQQKIKREQQEQIMNNFVAGSNNNNNYNNIVTKNDPDKNVVLVDDGIPFACYLCREHFKDPVVTNCYHYFCEKCIMDHIRSNINDECPICHKDTGSVFNCPTKLISKKRKLLGRNSNSDVQDEESWIKYFQTFKS